jgi:hypothetical protein
MSRTLTLAAAIVWVFLWAGGLTWATYKEYPVNRYEVQERYEVTSEGTKLMYFVFDKHLNVDSSIALKSLEEAVKMCDFNEETYKLTSYKKVVYP